MFIKNDINQFGGKYIWFIDRLKYYLYFVRSMFIAPEGYYYWEDAYVCFYRQIYPYFYSMCGVICIILCVISFVVNHKQKVIKLSAIWVLFSFVILCLIGWGTAENGMILYSYYFIWPFVILIAFLFKNLDNKVFFILICIVMIIMLFYNYLELSKIITFGCERYKMIFDFFGDYI